MKLLVVNIFFDPLSFGGATIVAEQMADQMSRRHGFEVVVVSARIGYLPAASVVRHRTRSGLEAFNVGLPFIADFPTHYDNPRFTAQFREILDYVEPDIVHVHCVQDIGAGFFDVLVERNVPFVVSVHDFWWVCERQFMITAAGDVCEQRVIDPGVCVRCGASRPQLERRLTYLKGQLAKADLVIVPSRFVAGYAADNGIPADKLVILPHGVPAPSLAPPRRSPEETVFGFVGGPGLHKGWDMIRNVFPRKGTSPAHLLIVDAGQRVGQPWRDRLAREATHLDMTIVPPYKPSTIDSFFSEIDVLLVPSIVRESFGLTAREALLRDVWVIAADAGALAEDIVDGENGAVLPYPPTESALAAAIEARIGKPKEPLPYKEKVFTIERQGKELAALLSKVVDTRQRKLLGKQ